MRLFKRKADTKGANNALAEKVAENILTKHRQLADYLNAKSKGFSKNAIGYTIIGFCVAFGSYCAYLIFGAIHQ